MNKLNPVVCGFQDVPSVLASHRVVLAPRNNRSQWFSLKEASKPHKLPHPSVGKQNGREKRGILHTSKPPR